MMLLPWCHAVGMASKYSTYAQQRVKCLRMKNSSCRTSSDELSPFAQSQSQVRPILGRTPGKDPSLLTRESSATSAHGKFECTIFSMWESFHA